jgi:hypothetical protein
MSKGRAILITHTILFAYMGVSAVLFPGVCNREFFVLVVTELG